jgi:PAS domain S-box-containing protein
MDGHQPHLSFPSAERIESFALKSRSLRERLVARTLDAGVPAEPPAAAAMDDLFATVEELSVAEEELRQQNEELIVRQEVIEEEHRRYQALFDLAPDAYLVTDARGVIREANRAAGALLGVRPCFLVGKPLAVFAGRADRRAIDAALGRLRDGALEAEWSAALRPRGGEPVPVSIRVAAEQCGRARGRELRWIVRDASEHVRERDALETLVEERTAALHDAVGRVTALLDREREAGAEARRAVESRDALLATVSHEMRNALHAIAGYAELLLLESESIPEGSRRHIEAVRRSGEHLHGLVERILDHFRAARGATVEGEGGASREAILVRDVAAHACDVAAAQLAARGHCLQVIGCDPELTALGDAGRVEQILLNLLGNAAKFTPPGGEITLEWERVGAEAHIRVRDGGIGIAAADLERIFEPFTRLAADVAAGGGHGRRGESGLGLGLPISRELARAMGGELTVESVAGVGSTFTLRLAADPPRPP